MKHLGWLGIGLICLGASVGRADSLPYTCDDLDTAQCSRDTDQTDTCSATNGIDSFLDKAVRDDDEHATENKCVVSLRIAHEICASQFDPADFDITCKDKDDVPATTPTPTPDPGDDRPSPPPRRNPGEHHHHHGGTPGEGHPGSHGHHGGFRNHPGGHPHRHVPAPIPTPDPGDDGGGWFPF